MKIRLLRIANFRGFEVLELRPRGHVFLVGQPGAGRSDLVEALWRVLCAESARFPLSEDLDFFKRDLTRRIEIEVVLGKLGPHLEQAFLDRLELWDPKARELVEELSPEAEGEEGSLEHVVRLCYRAVWDTDQQQARHWVDFPKFSKPDAEEFRAVPRALREELPAVFVSAGGSPLSLGARGDLRRLVDGREKKDFSDSLDHLMERIAQLAEDLVESKDLSDALERILDPLRTPLNLGDRPAADVVRFAPEGGSLAGVLRGLQPTVKLRDELGFLPLGRHGSTLTGLLQLSRAIAQAESAGAVVVIDDFGEGIDPDAAQHLAATLRARAAQLWLSSRTGPVGQCFRPRELVRLTVSHEGVRSLHIGQMPKGRSERIAARHLHLQILPAISSRAVVIVEGPHDRAALTAAATKLNLEEGVPLPAARRIGLLDAGAAEGSGGISAVPRLAKLARQLGFHVIALVDWDRDPKAAKERLDRTREAADVVVRWPQGHAIERALVGGLDDNIVRAALRDLSEALSVPLEFDPDAVSADDLVERATKFLKSSGGLQGPFVDALPAKCAPPLLRKCLEEIRGAVTKSGVVQL